MTDLNPSNAVVVAKGLGKTYSGNGSEILALDDVCLEIHEGEFVAVCGPSGCGKSTLLLILGLLLNHDTGSLVVSGNNVSEISQAKKSSFRAEHIGFVFQDFHLIPYLSVMDNVLVPSLAQALENPKDRASMLLAEMGLENRLNHLPSELSSGERQRTALVRALLLEPALILADEPTGNLDQENAGIVLDHLSAYASSGGAVLMATHAQDAMKRSGRQIFLDQGVHVSRQVEQ